MLGSLILYLRAMRIVMFQLSGFCCEYTGLEFRVLKVQQYHIAVSLQEGGGLR